MKAFEPFCLHCSRSGAASLTPRRQRCGHCGGPTVWEACESPPRELVVALLPRPVAEAAPTGPNACALCGRMARTKRYSQGGICGPCRWALSDEGKRARRATRERWRARAKAEGRPCR